jgi:hypothetical protein
MVMLTIQLSASIVLTISPLYDGTCQIIAPGNSNIFAPVEYCVLQTSTNCIVWTSVSTNAFPYSGYGVTNIVETTNVIMFYRVEAYHL